MAVLHPGTMEVGPRKARRGKSLLQDTKSRGQVRVQRRQVQAQKGAKREMTKEAGEKAVNKIKATEMSSAKNTAFRKSTSGNCNASLMARKGSLRKTQKSQTEANDKGLAFE